MEERMEERIGLLLDTASKAVGVDITGQQQDKLWKYADMLVERNKSVNLTAITDFDQIAVKHFADSLSIIPILRERNINTLVDVGTGAGFPGIPVKICCPDMRILLIDSLDKRIKFMDEVINMLGMSGIETLHARAEDAGRDLRYRECFDASVARAVAAMPVLLEYCVPFVKTGGYFIAMKSQQEEKFDKALKVLDCAIENDIELQLPFEDEEFERHIFVVKKVKKLSMQFPRKAGTPTKRPLV